jgi:hypothetical protein
MSKTNLKKYSRGGESDFVDVVVNVMISTKGGEFLGQQLLEIEHEGMGNVKFCLSKVKLLKD